MRVAAGAVLVLIFVVGVWASYDSYTRGESPLNGLLALMVGVVALVTLVTAPDLSEVEHRLERTNEQLDELRASADKISQIRPSVVPSRNPRGGTVVVIAAAVGGLAAVLFTRRWKG